jgi:tRNA (cytidine/uridine-2'-O-)-methyltransferase
MFPIERDSGLPPAVESASHEQPVNFTQVRMLHVALFEPEIPPNTGNVARLCAATASRLHLIGKLGFTIDDKQLKRAGLDYWPYVDLVRHGTFEEFEISMDSTGTDSPGTVVPGLRERLWVVDNPAPRRHTDVPFQDGDCLLFGKESTGLPTSLREKYADRLVSIPMFTAHVRSLNLSTSVGIAVYEALRQVHGW